MRRLIMLCVIVGCMRKVPPPMADGRCLVDSWKGSYAERQACVYEGYVWRCSDNSCYRTDEDPKQIFPAERPR